MQLSEENKHKVRESLPQIHNLFVINLIKALKEGRLPSKAQLELLDKAVAMPEDSTAPPPAAEPAFNLSADSPQGRAGLADFYEVNVRTINRWQKMGEQKGVPCPVHSPAAMIDWWKAVSKKPVDKHIVAAAEKCSQKADVAAPAAAPDAGSKLPRLDLSNFNPADYDYDGLLMSMRTIMMAEEHLLREAMASGDKVRINQAKSDLRGAVESLRKLEKDSGKILADQGLTMRSADVRAAIVEAHQFIPARFKTVLKAMVRSLPGLTMSESEMDAWAERTVDDACASLVKTDLVTPNLKAA
jgi:hypothetical protein